MGPRLHESARSLLTGAVALGVIAAGSTAGCRCSKTPLPAAYADASASGSSAVDGNALALSRDAALEAGGLSAPIAASRLEGGDVVVVGLDAASHAVRAFRISPSDEVLSERKIFDGAQWSSDAELKVVPAARGVAVTWRGRRDGGMVRQMLVLGADFAPKAEAVEVTAASCATRDALWFIDGKRAHSHAWTGASTRTQLPRDAESSLACGPQRVFALLDEDDGTSLLFLGGAADALGRVAQGGAAEGAVVSLLRESEFGDDEQRERVEYAVGDDLGVVRVASSGRIAIREVKAASVGPLRHLKTTIPHDDEIVAVDASTRSIVVVFSEDVSAGCVATGGGAGVSTKVMALRIDRTTFEESLVEISKGMCGREVGPFFTGVVGDGVAVAWVERVPLAGNARAPIAGLANVVVPATGAPPPLARIDQPADALVDAGCDGTRCAAVALARKPGMDGMVPGVARVLRYP